MYFKYGSYSHDASEASVQVARRNLYSRRGNIERVRKTLRVSGALTATSEANMTTAIAAMEAAYADDGRDAGLYQTDDTLIADHALDNSSSIGGVRVMSIEYPQGDGVYATNRPFSIILEADYYPDSLHNTTELTQMIRRIGTGGPKRVLVPLLDGPADIQIPQTHTICYAMQSGRAMGVKTYPARRSPLWPTLEEVDRRDWGTIEPTYENGDYTNYGVTWSYYFSNNLPF